MATAADESYNSPSHVTIPSKEQEELFSCTVCQCRLEDPKDLECRHSFCKSCLDEMLVFKENGEASIQCPMRCDSLTTIDENKTTNDLKTSYSFKSIVCWLEEQDKRLDSTDKEVICEANESCTNAISIYCSLCRLMMCQKCSVAHKTKCNGEKCYQVKFNSKTSSQMALCKEHNTYATYICCDKNLICIYCVQRKHKDHIYTGITTVADRIRNELGMIKCNDPNNSQENTNIIGSAFQATEIAINDVRYTLMASLAERMIKCMGEYFAQLTEIHERYLNVFEKFVEDNTKDLPEFISHKSTKDWKGRPCFALAIEEENIHETLGSGAIKEFSVPSYNVCLTKGDPTLPLGDLKIDFVEDVPLTNNGLNKPTLTTSLSNIEDGREAFELIDQLHALFNRGKNFINQKSSVRNEETSSCDEEQGWLTPDVSLLSEAPRPHDKGKNFINQKSSVKDEDTSSCDEEKGYITPDISLLSDAPRLHDKEVFPSPSSEIRNVKILRDSNGRFGFSFHSTSNGFEVHSIKDEQRCHELREGDIILTINNNDIQKLQYSEVVEIFKSCSKTILTDFQVKRSLRKKTSDDSASLSTSKSHPVKTHLLTITRGRRGFGFTIEHSPFGPRVKFVRDDRRCHGLQFGDVIVSINDINVQDIEFPEVVKILKSCPLDETSVLQIQR